jgi:hypothetical protein
MTHSSADGLVICASCRSGLVMSRQGHYVRDPFRRHSTISARQLRLQSHPLNRVLRDAGVLTPSFTAIAVLTLVGLTSLNWGPVSGQLNQIRNFVEMKSPAK